MYFSGERAECSLLKSRLDAQAKEISQLKHHIKQLEEKERSANENVKSFIPLITLVLLNSFVITDYFMMLLILVMSIKTLNENTLLKG